MHARGLVIIGSLWIAATCLGGGPIAASDGAAVATNAVAPIREHTMGINEKMQAIVIPEIVFRQASIQDVVAFLVKAGIESDTTTSDPKLKGVNIILNLKGAGRVPEITFTAREITLFNALKVITQVSGLKYYVDGNAVMIVRAN